MTSKVMHTLARGSRLRLIDHVSVGGIHIRQYYVSLAPPGNAALPGLATYASAQLVELGLAESLTGVPANDLPILQTIRGDVMAGIQLNENNTAAVRHQLGFFARKTLRSVR